MRKLLILFMLAGCGGLQNPVLVLDVRQVPECTGAIQVSVSKGAATSSPVSFFRDSTNRYVSLSPAMPPMVPGPAQAKVAVDLPAGTSGVITANVEAVMPAAAGGNATVLGEATDHLQIDGSAPYVLVLTLRPGTACTAKQ